MRQPAPPPVLPERTAIPHAEALALGRAVLSPLIPLLAVDDDGRPRAQWTGSIRRRCSTVNDIDCVLLPAPGQKQRIQHHLYICAHRQICRGEVKQSVLLTDAAGTGLIQMDVWFARDMATDAASATPDMFA